MACDSHACRFSCAYMHYSIGSIRLSTLHASVYCTQAKKTTRTEQCIPRIERLRLDICMPNRLPDIDSVRLESPMAPALPCRNAHGRYVVRMSEWQRAHARAVHTHRFLNGPCRRHDFKRAFSCVQAALPRSIVVRNNRFRKRDRNVNLQSSVTTVFLFYEPKSLYKPEVSETK